MADNNHCYSTYRSLWEATNNTVGFNHMIASANDAVSYSKGNKEAVVAYAMETMYNYTAFFMDNDERLAMDRYGKHAVYYALYCIQGGQGNVFPGAWEQCTGAHWSPNGGSSVEDQSWIRSQDTGSFRMESGAVFVVREAIHVHT